MWSRSPIFRRLLLSCLLLVFVTISVLDFFLTRLAEQQQKAAVESQLAAEARLLADELAAVPGASLQAWTKQAEKRAQARITIIDRVGIVRADSQGDPESMENHAQRPEVREAMQGRAGSAVRRSRTLNRELAYLAVPLQYEGNSGFVLRLAIPVQQIHIAASDVRNRILLASLFAAALALLLSYFFSRRFTERVRRLQVFADSLPASGDQPVLPPESDDELGAVVASLNRMSKQVSDLLDQTNLEARRRDAILASMVEGVLAVDGELRVIFCNEAFARAVAVQTLVPERLPVLDLVRDPELVDMLSHVLVTGEVIKARLQLSQAGGRWFEVQTAPLAAGSRRGVIALLHDISDIDRLERVRKDFVANVSHEFRTPLTAIRGCAETLLDGALEDVENRRRFVEIIRAHSVRLNNIASDLLILSELESDRPEPAPETLSVLDTLDTACSTVESAAKVRSVRIMRERNDDAWVTGHRVRLEQTFVNLLDNAVKFNRPGGEVRINCALDGDTVRVSVADTGVGIPADYVSRIFERFYRVDKARSREVGGTGLGLSIVKHVVERMNGRINVESEPGRGSTFEVVLPTTQP